jgi:hypothetical protein
VHFRALNGAVVSLCLCVKILTTLALADNTSMCQNDATLPYERHTNDDFSNSQEACVHDSCDSHKNLSQPTYVRNSGKSGLATRDAAQGVLFFLMLVLEHVRLHVQFS